MLGRWVRVLCPTLFMGKDRHSLCEAAEQAGGGPEAPPRSASWGTRAPGHWAHWHLHPLLSVTLPSLLMVRVAGRRAGSAWAPWEGAPFPVGLHRPPCRAQHGTYEWGLSMEPEGCFRLLT